MHAMGLKVFVVLLALGATGVGIGYRATRATGGSFVAEARSGAGAQLAEVAFDVANDVFLKAKVVAYHHLPDLAGNQVRLVDGDMVAQTDCSGFVSYVLNKSAPKHYEAVLEFARRRYVQTQQSNGAQPEEGKPLYPEAKDYADFFGTLKAGSTTHGWTGVATVWDLRKGDIIAWGKNNWDGKGDSGHVAIVIEPPDQQLVEASVKETGADGVEAESTVQCVNLHVLDSSAVYHFPAEELPPRARPVQKHRDGLGKGYIRLVLDSGGAPVRYWEGLYQGDVKKEIKAPSISADIHFGRLID